MQVYTKTIFLHTSYTEILQQSVTQIKEETKGPLELATTVCGYMHICDRQITHNV